MDLNVGAMGVVITLVDIAAWAVLALGFLYQQGNCSEAAHGYE
jgi:hypothetical protein